MNLCFKILSHHFTRFDSINPLNTVLPYSIQVLSPTTGSCCLKNRQTCSKSYPLYTPHAKYNRVEVQRVRRPERGWDKIWRLWPNSAPVSLVRCDGHSILLKDETSLPDAARISWSVRHISRTSGQIWITLLLNVLLANGASDCALAFVLDTDI